MIAPRHAPTVVAAAILAAALVTAAPAGASAAATRPAFTPRLTPATPTLRTPITLTWRASAPKSGVSYGARIAIANRVGLACTTDTTPVRLRAAADGRLTATFRPAAWVNQGSGVWCPGKARVSIRRYGPGAQESVVLARRVFTIRVGARETAPEKSFLPAKIVLLRGSTLTASAPGRPDRSSAIAGTLRGKIPGRFEPTADVRIEDFGGALGPLALGADPLCPGTAPPVTVDVVPTSTMTLFTTRRTDLSLVLSGGPSQLIGCGPAGLPAGTTTIPLTGTAEPGTGLLRLRLTGAVDGIGLPGGAQGRLAVDLQVNVNF